MISFGTLYEELSKNHALLGTIYFQEFWPASGFCSSPEKESYKTNSNFFGDNDLSTDIILNVRTNN